MSDSPPHRRRSTPRRLVSLVDCGNSSPQRVTLSERLDEGVPHSHGQTTIIHECIRLAWNMVFSAVGARVTAQSLLESWLEPSEHPAPSLAEVDLIFAQALAEVESFEKSYPVIVYMTAMIGSPEVRCREEVAISLGFLLSEYAAEAHSRSLIPGASLNAQFRRHRHVFFIAVLIAHGLQQATHKIRPEELASGRDHCASSNPPHFTFDKKTGHPLAKRIRDQKFIAAAWRFEETMLGGHLAVLRGTSSALDSETIPCGIAGVVVMMASEGIPGYRTISDEAIKAIVEDANCDRYLPLGPQHKHDFVAGIHPKTAYRIGDGSDELCKGLLPRYCTHNN